MSQIANQILNGHCSEETWNQYLIEAHREAPSMTPAAFAPYKTKSGLNSYQILAEQIGNLRGTKSTVLDLACGDGHLIQFLLPILGAKSQVIGVDMSDGELAVAKKNYASNPQVSFHQARARELPLSDGSVDAVLSHMAFMLMMPLDPVVDEMNRVLKSGGRFSAVVGHARSTKGFLGGVLKTISQFIGSHYPKLSNSKTGDARVQSKEGIESLFSSERGFSKGIEIYDFALMINTDSNGVWNLLKDMYFVSMLPQSEREKLGHEVKNFTAQQANSSGIVSFEFEMRLFSATKS